MAAGSRSQHCLRGDDHPAGSLRIGYLAKLPPSNSGVARYASHFAGCLRLLSEHLYLLPIRRNAAETQRVATILRTCALMIMVARRRGLQVLHVELAGRSLAEFYAALAVSVLCPRLRLWLTVHDAPQVTGGACYVWVLDRKGLRRVAHRLSTTVGVRMERRLLERAEHVFCLSARGAAAVTDGYGLRRSVAPIPLVARVPAMPHRSDDGLTIFCPGHIGWVEAVMPVVHALLQPQVPPDVRVDVGHCDEATERSLRRWVVDLGLSRRVRFLGYLPSDAELDDAFARASIVVRHQPWSEIPAGNWAAVSGPVVAAMAWGCAVITSDPRGIGEYVDDGVTALNLAGRPGDVEHEVVRLILDRDLRRGLGLRARRYIEECHSPVAVARRLRQIVGPCPTSSPAESCP